MKVLPKYLSLKKKPLDKISEKNLAGLTFQIFKNGEKKIYSIFEGMPIKQKIRWDQDIYLVELRPLQSFLPFFIHLLDFEKGYYPGTDRVSSYQSTVEIRDQMWKQKRVIKMNQPLRYKGYTFYQSSFIEDKESESTVLAVVKNAGRAFPYLSSLMIAFGLMVHILLNISSLRKKPKRI